MSNALTLPQRVGPAPATTSHLPHSQLTQHGPDAVVDQLREWAFSLTGVEEAPSGVAVAGSRALTLREDVEGNTAAFMVGREFAHIHPDPDNGSMHLMLPPADAREVVSKGWGEDHYLVTAGTLPTGLVLVFSPRDQNELAISKDILARSHQFATEPSPTL